MMELCEMITTDEKAILRYYATRFIVNVIYVI